MSTCAETHQDWVLCDECFGRARAGDVRYFEVCHECGNQTGPRTEHGRAPSEDDVNVFTPLVPCFRCDSTKKKETTLRTGIFAMLAGAYALLIGLMRSARHHSRNDRGQR